MLVSKCFFFMTLRFPLTAVLNVAVVMFGPSAAMAEFVTIIQEGFASAEFSWNDGDVAEEDKDGFRSERGMPAPQFSANATVRGPALIRAAAYQDQNGVNAVSADSGVALLELPSFIASAETNHFFLVTEYSAGGTGTVDFDFVINGANCELGTSIVLCRIPAISSKFE